MGTIVFIAYHFAPENASGTHRPLHFARALQDAGHDVKVITGPAPPTALSDPDLWDVFPWPAHVRRVAPAPSLTGLYMGMKRWRGRTTAEGDSGRGTATPADTLRSPVGRAVAVLRHHLRIVTALPDVHRAWRGPAARAGIALGRRAHADAVFASGPPWSALLVGHRIASVLRVPFVADFRDPWTERTGATWCHAAAWAERRARHWEAAVLEDAALVLFNSPRVASSAIAQTDLGTRAHTLLNGSEVPRRSVPAVLPASQPLAFRHFGSLYAGRSVMPLVRALEGLVACGDLQPEEVEIELVGNTEVSDWERAQLQGSRVAVRQTAQIPFSMASARMAEKCVLVAVQADQYASQIPTKLFDYLCTGNPIVLVAPHASASWDMAASFPRCHRLDPAPSERNQRVLAQIIELWRAGRLCQEATAQDTQDLTKTQIGAHFVRLMEDVVARSPVR